MVNGKIIIMINTENIAFTKSAIYLWLLANFFLSAFIYYEKLLLFHCN